jgi:hypothetical protein
MSRTDLCLFMNAKKKLEYFDWYLSLSNYRSLERKEKNIIIIIVLFFQ